MRRRPDPPALVAGIALLGLGGLLWLDELGVVRLGVGWVAPAICAVVGAVLLTTGLSRRS